VVDATGMVVIRGQLDPANGAAFLAALDALSAPVPVDPDSQLPIPDDRSKGQRQADGLGLMARIALQQLGQVGEGRAETDRPKVVIHLPAAEEQHLGALTPAWLARFACDSIVEAVDTDKLNLGHAVRTATAVQKRFLAARDGGCVIPGCHAPPAWTDAHHVDWWSTGGATDVTNMALVCGRHHSAVHAGIWSLEMINGVPWATPPRWIDREQKPLRNTYRQHRQAAEQLALDLSPPADDG
jgi:Domain of unknown function (DUF222)